MSVNKYKLLTFSTFFLHLFFLLSFNFTSFAQPANDDCIGATLVIPDSSCNSISGDFTGATISNFSSTNSNYDIWYKFTAVTTTHYINITGSGDFKAGLQLFSNTCGSLTSIGNPITGTATSMSVTIPSLTIGTTYYYRVFHNTYLAAPSSTSISTCVENFIKNDNCTGAYTLIAGNPGETAFPTNGRTSGASQSMVACKGTADDDVWYKFQATNKLHYISVTGSANFDAVVQLFNGTCSSLTSLNCQDASSNGQLETISNNTLIVGNWYYVRVYHSANTNSNTPYFSISINTPPSNDDCSGASLMKLGTTCSETFGDGTYATQSLVASSGKGNANDDMWYKFVADTSIAFISVTPSSNYNPVIQVFSDCSTSPTPLTPIFYDDASYTQGSFGNALVTGLVKGNTYYYRIYDFASTNPITMSFNTCVVNPVKNDNCDKAFKMTTGYTCKPTDGDGIYTTQSLPSTGNIGNANDDLWYKFTATNTSHFISVNASLLFDPIVEVFSACSSTPTKLAPAFNNDADYPIAKTGSAKVSGLTIGSTYYYRIFDKSANNPATTTFSTCVTTPPINDDCNGSLILFPNESCTTVTSNSTYASQSLATNCSGDANDDVWFKFVAQSPSQFISVEPTDSGFDPIVEVFSACSTTPTKLTPTFCNDALYGKGVFGNGMVTGLTTGNTYYYRVFDKAAIASNPDTMTFNTCVVNPVINDDCTGAISVTPSATCTPVYGDGLYATQSLVQCAGNAGAANDDVWFKFVASKTVQFISVKPNDSKYDAVVQVYSNCATTPTSISCNDVYPTGSFGTVGISGLTEGNTYYYRVYDKNTTNQDTMTFETCVVEQISNDECVNATSIVPSTSYAPIIGDGTYATTSLAGCIGSANDDVWYKFTATSTKEFISVEAPKNYDPVIQVFSACSTPLAPAICNNTSYPISSFGTSSFTTTIGSTYYYRIYDNSATNTYPMQFKTAVTSAPLNDECSGAVNVPIGPSSIVADGTFGSQSLVAGSCGGVANDDVWFKFTATNASHTIYVNSSTDYDPVVQLYANCSTTPTPFPNASSSCDDTRFPKNGTGSNSFTGLTVGTTYYYRVYDAGSTTPSIMTFTTNVTLPPSPPVNDEPCKAIYISASSTCTFNTYTNEAATATVGPPAPGCASYSGGDVWFKTKVPFSGELTIDTKDFTITDGGMAIYSGRCNSLNLITCDDNSGNGSMPKINSKSLSPGDTIWIRVWEYGNNNNGTFGICITKPVEATLVGSCTNTDLSNGLTGWFGTTGSVNAAPTGSASPKYIPTTSNVTPPSLFSIVTTGIDPICGFPKVCPGYASSLLLGDGVTVKSPHGATIEQYFPVTASNAFFIYNYAAVLQNGGHASNEQPFFKVELFDDDGNQISCGDYLVAAPQTGYGDKIGFQKAPNKTDVIYKSWTKVGIGLKPYIGKNVHVRFTSGDCAQGGHYGYVYLAFACAPFELIKPASICLGDTAKLFAPKGATTYTWINASTREELSKTDSLIMVPNVAGTFPITCFVTMFGTSLCKDSLTTTITVGATPTLTIIDPAPKCLNDSIDITLPAITAGSTPNLTYSYWQDNATSIALTNQKAIKTAGTYFIKGEKSPTCKDIKPVKVDFNPLPLASITGTTSICKNDPAPIVTLTGSNATAPYTFTYNIDGGINKTIVSSGNTAFINVPSSVKGTFVYNLLEVKDGSSTTCSQAQIGNVTVKVNDVITQTINCGTKTTNSVQFKWNENPAATSYNYTYTTDLGKSGNGTLTTGSTETTISGLTLNEKVDIIITPVGDPCGKVFSGSCTSLNCNSPIVNPKAPIVQCNNTLINAITYTSTPIGGKIKWTNGWNPSSKIGQKDSATGIFPAFTAINNTLSPILDTIFITASDISCTGPAAEHYITINPDAHVNAPSDISVCTGDNTTDIYFSSNNTGGITTYSWTNNTPSIGLTASGNGDILGFTTSNTTNNAVVASITVTPHFTNAGVSCDGPTKTFTITVNPLPKINAGNDTSICNTKSLKIKGSGGLNYVWNNNITDNVLFTPSNTNTYKVIGTDVNGCENTDSLIITVLSLPNVNAGKDTTICNGTKAVLKGSGANSYVWDNGILDNVPFSPTLKLTYKVIGTDLNGCENSDLVDVSINQQPNVDAGKDQAICIGSTIVLKGFGADTYSWNNGVIDNTSFQPTINQTYILIGADAFGCVNSDTIVVTVNPLPVVSAGNDTTICQGFNAVVKGKGADTYTWDKGVTDGVPFKVTSNNKYIVIGTDLNGCTNKDSMLVSVNAMPIVDAGKDTALCKGETISLKANGNALIYNWDQGVIDNSTFIPSQTRQYILRGNDAINCTSSDTVIITINELPKVNAGNDTSICIGQSTKLSATGAISYSWNNGITNNVTFKPISTKEYTVIGTDIFGCINKDSLVVTVNLLPNIFAGKDTAICKGDAITLKGVGGNSYAWNNSVLDNISFTPINSNNYILIGTDINGCSNKDTLAININPLPIITTKEVCENKEVILTANHIPSSTSPWNSAEPSIAIIDASGKTIGIKGGQSLITFTDNLGCKDFKYVIVNPSPSILTSPLSLCVKSKLKLSANHPGNINNAWIVSNTNVIISNNSTEILAENAGNTELTYTDNKGCNTTKSITINPLPKVDFISEKSICIDDSIFMKDLSVPSSMLAYWSYGDGTHTLNSSHKYQKGGVFSITLTSISKEGCKDSITKIDYLEVIQKPSVSFTFTPDSIDIFNPEIYFKNNSNAKHYKWIFGDDKPISVNSNPTHVFPSTTGQHYIVTLTGYNTDNGCDTSYQQEIVSKEPLIFYIPNTFTPNGDEFNNTFKPIFYSGLDIYNFHLSIYNRWGELIFESSNPEFGWDGTYGNQIVESATYIWKVEFKEKLSDKRHNTTGHVNVLR